MGKNNIHIIFPHKLAFFSLVAVTRISKLIYIQLISIFLIFEKVCQIKNTLNLLPMKKIHLIILLGFFTFPFVLNAQVLTDQQKSLYEYKVIRFTKMKHTGVGLTIGGAILSVAGVAMIVNSGYLESNSTSDDGAGLYLLGYLSTSLGVGMTAGGIVLWTIGGRKTKEYNQKLNSFSLNLNPASHQLVSLSYRF